MASLADLLRYKKEISILAPDTTRVVKKIWIRVLGDLDLTISYKAARLASSAKRAALRDIESDDYKDEVLGVSDLSPQEQRDVIKTSRLSNIISEAMVAIERPELPKLEEVSIEPDAATLEELEIFDATEKKIDDGYQKKIEEYIQLKTDELEQQLLLLSAEELVIESQKEVSNLVPFSIFMTELNAQKAFYGTFQDQACKMREFESIEDFRQLPKSVQEQIIYEINTLEISGADIKN